MRVSKREIEEGRVLLRSKGWLSSCPPHFGDAVLSEVQWSLVDPDFPVVRGFDPGGGLMALARGQVGIIPSISAPDAGLIHVERAPFWFGLKSVLSGELSQVSIVARSPSLVGQVSQAAMGRVLAEHPEGWRMLAVHSDGLTTLALQCASDLLLPDPARRCAAVLLRLAGARHPGGYAQQVQCSHDELASMCNLSRSSISVMLKRFESLTLIETGYRCISVRQPDALRAIVDHC